MHVPTCTCRFTNDIRLACSGSESACCTLLSAKRVPNRCAAMLPLRDDSVSLQVQPGPNSVHTLSPRCHRSVAAMRRSFANTVSTNIPRPGFSTLIVLVEADFSAHGLRARQTQYGGEKKTTNRLIPSLNTINEQRREECLGKYSYLFCSAHHRSPFRDFFQRLTCRIYSDVQRSLRHEFPTLFARLAPCLVYKFTQTISQ